MEAFKRVLRVIFSIYAFLVFVVIMLIIFPFVLLASLFGKINGGNWIYRICRVWSDSTLFLWGIWHKNYYEAPRHDNTAVVYVFNHISYLDIPLLLKVFRHTNVRILAKAELAKVPIFGYIYSRAAILVRRSSPQARAKSIADMTFMLRNNISMVLAPEGTFNTTHRPLKDFYDGAFRIAIETKTPLQPVIFLDSYDRLNYRSVFSLNPGRSRAVFLTEVEVKDYKEAEVEVLKAKVYSIMEAALIRYKASWIR